MGADDDTVEKNSQASAEPTSHRDEILRDEFLGMIVESALAKKGFVLTPEHITDAFVKFVGQYDYYVALWNVANNVCSLVVRWSTKHSEYLRGNTIIVRDRETALALYDACRADDNGAPELLLLSPHPLRS